MGLFACTTLSSGDFNSNKDLNSIINRFTKSKVYIIILAFLSFLQS
jgi:hypothetical protein